MSEKQIIEREKKIINCILENKITAIIRGVEESKISKVAEALYRGGIKLVEVTFNMSAPHLDQAVAKQITMIKELLGDKITIGAGTVMTTEQVDIANAAHADFIVSPNTDEEVIRYTKEIGLVSIPGAFTASEIATAQRAGANFIKVFPISVCGEAYIKAIKAPLSEARLIAVGGVDETNIRKFLDAGCIGVGVGGKLVSKNNIADGQFSEIEETARRLVACIK
ncbi:MAG: bifunctional 4-hydroxy-2-oxoglutarate aldolase/2-dehydro-3-deoxy-phosphogluconate aldolase [Eubacteriales bacterium]|nr:bifunctional 4-hydroxy-2-oxoglutarate aldolase/2-dehydro-3-deoxy-phosphogluconate aldolase [Eubacteriales bacterium]